jgi:predicted nucleic acid-binding protein
MKIIGLLKVCFFLGFIAKINNRVRAIFIYSCFGVSVSTVDRVLNSTWVDF